MSSTYILCVDCAAKWRLVGEDKAAGWKFRIVPITRAKVPPGHQIEFHSWGQESKEPVKEIIPVNEIVCDHCNAGLTGGPAFALTVWRGDEPGDWESGYDAGA